MSDPAAINPEEAKGDQVTPKTKSSEGSESELEEGNYVVEKIVKHRTKGEKTEYFIKWKGYSEADNTWEIESNINDKKLVEDYWEAPVYIGGRYGPPKEPKVEKTVVTINYEKTRLPSWEDDVDQVETITKDERGNLIVFLLWKDGPRTVHSTGEANLKCPQKMIKFYESCVKIVSNPNF